MIDRFHSEGRKVMW